MKAIIGGFLCLILQVSSNLVSENNIASFLASQYCTHGEVLSCSSDCKGRKFCMYGQEQTIDCYTQTGKSNCDPKTLECTTRISTCDTEDLPKFICPGIGYYPHALNCSKVWFCGSEPPATILNCGNMIFDPLSRQCTAGIPCYTFSPVNGLCRGKEGAIVVHPLNKAIYAFCSGSFPQIGECPLNNVFNPSKLKCEYSCKSVGRFPDPDDEECFYSCSRPTVAIVSEHICCPAGQIFNPDNLLCTPKIS